MTDVQAAPAPLANDMEGAELPRGLDPGPTHCVNVT